MSTLSPAALHRPSLACLFAFSIALPPLWGLGEEELGNKPVNGVNYEGHPGLIDVLNNTHRVYRFWVNGNEKFFFRGDTIALNEALQEYAKVTSDKLEIVIRPGPTETSTFNQEKTVAYNWHLHLVGGIAGHLSKSDKGHNVWPKHPIMYVYIGDTIQLSQLEIPEGVDVIELSELKARYAEALSSTDTSVRGWACGRLASLDPHCEESMHRVASMLNDDENWVRLNAAGALATYGSLAKKVLPQLKETADTEDERLAKRASETMEGVLSAEVKAQDQQQHQQQLAAISEFCEKRK